MSPATVPSRAVRPQNRPQASNSKEGRLYYCGEWQKFKLKNENQQNFNRKANKLDQSP